jgi:hypothetical protein
MMHSLRKAMRGHKHERRCMMLRQTCPCTTRSKGRLSQALPEPLASICRW